MITFPSAILCLALAQQSAPAVLDQRFLPEHGLVTLSAEGARLEVRMEKGGATKEHAFVVPDLAREDRILEARCGPWLGDEMVIVLATRTGETTTYRYVLSAFRDTGRLTRDVEVTARFADPERNWFLAKPLFTSTGEPFRIVAVNDHHQGGSDMLEVTFRRGWIDRIEQASKIEEKILFDCCGSYWPEPLVNGRAVLYETPSPR